jgi:TP901 family phage tail tape measure protein
MTGSIYELAILLSLKDAASGGLNRTEAHLRSLGKEGKDTLKTFQQLRSDMKKDLTIAGVGVGMLALMRGGVREAGNFEAAMADLRMSIEELGDDGTLNVAKLNNEYGKLESIGIRIGNKLPGTTQDFIEMFSTLKENGIKTETIINGAGDAVANLAVVTHSIPRDLAEPFAQYAQQFQLTGEEAIKLADVLARIRFATGLKPAELIEGSKFFQLRAGLPLGFTGLQGADRSGRLLATLRSYGLEGGIGGRELGGFMLSLTFNSKEKQKLLAELRHKEGIELKFFDQKGSFLGIENAFAQMEKFRKLSTEKQIKYGEKLFDREGMAIASVFMKSGVDGWQKINQRIDKVPALQELINQKTETYNAKLEAVKGTLTNLEATAFTPLLDHLKPVLDTANDLTGSMQSFAKTNPGIADVVGTTFALGAATLTVTYGIKAATTAWGLFRIASGLAAGQSLTDMAKVRAGSSMLGGQLKALATPIKITIIAAELYELYKLTKEYSELRSKLYPEAAAGEQRSGVESLRSLTALRKGYAKQGMAVPQEVYAARASDLVRSLRETGVLDAINPGLEGTQRHFLNPYGVRYPEANFLKQTPELADPGLMRAFLEKIQRSFPADLVEKMTKSLEAKFPASVHAAQAGDPQLQAVSQQWSNLLPPLQTTTDLMTRLGQPADRLPDSFTRIVDGATRVTSGLDSLSIRLGNWQPPGGQSATPGASSSPFPAVRSLLGVPSRAMGGLVEKAGLVMVHDREQIVPASVTRGLPGGGGHKTINVHVHIHGGTDNPRELARLVAYEVERQVERA